MSDPPNPLAEHLRFFQELGVTGLSRDARWRARAGDERPATVETGMRGAEAAAPADRSPVPADAWAPAPEPVSLFEEAPARATAAVTGDPGEALEALRAEIGDCTRCKLHALGRRQVVFGVGNPRARLMFVGEGPGQDEDEQGVPFVGRAGQLLTKAIEGLGFKREDVYIANVVKCRPPGNRNPEPDEVATCEPFLFRQIDTIRPKVIVALGTFAARTLLGLNEPISRLRGRVFTYRGAKLVPTFHPAFLLRNPGEDRKREAWNDFKMARALLDEE